MKSRTIITVVLLLLCSSVFADDILVGDAHRVWLVRPSADAKTCDVFVKELGVSWQVSARNQTGVPTTAVATGETLHLFYADRQHVVLDSHGGMRVADNLPGELTAVCSGENFGGAKKEPPTVFVLVQRDEPPSIPSSDPQPATAETTTSSTSPYECLYRLAGNQWMPIGRPALISNKESATSPDFLAILKGQLYRLDRPKGDGPKRPYVLRSFSPAPDGRADWTNVHTLPADPPPLGMTALKDRLLLVHRTETNVATTSPANLALTITRYNPSVKSPLTSLPIARNQAVAHWPTDAPPNVSRLGEQLALLWRDEKTTSFALCSPSGALGVAENVTQTIETIPNVEWASNLYNYFLMGLVIVIGVGMFFRRMRTPPKPFILATGLTPGNLFKRLLAALLDFLPFYFITGAFFLPTNLHLETVQQFIEKPSSIPPSLLVAMLYTMMLSQGLYIVYGTIMEMRFGATLGKMLLRLRTVREDGSKPGLREASLRNATKIVELSMLMSSMAWLMMIFVLLPLLTRNRQRLGDMIARTAVVETASLEAFRKAKPDGTTEQKENANQDV